MRACTKTIPGEEILPLIPRPASVPLSTDVSIAPYRLVTTRGVEG